MSLLGKKTFVEKVMESCTSDELLTVRSLINSMDSVPYTFVSLDPHSSNFISNSNKGVSYVSFQLSTLLALNEKGILVYTNDYCALFTTSGLNRVAEYQINVANHTYSQIYENLTAEEMRQVVNDLLVGIIARDSLFNAIDLTSLGTFTLENEVEMNSVEYPEIIPICVKLFNTYSSDKITVIKMLAQANDMTVTITASDTALYMPMETKDGNYTLIQIMAANIYKTGLSQGGPQENEGIYPNIQFIKGEGMGQNGADLYMITVGFYTYDDIEEAVSDLDNDSEQE